MGLRHMPGINCPFKIARNNGTHISSVYSARHRQAVVEEQSQLDPARISNRIAQRSVPDANEDSV